MEYDWLIVPNSIACHTYGVSSPFEVDPVVTRALDLSRKRGFITSTRNETGRLLAALAASKSGVLGELGTGCGVGAAWLHTGAPANARILTVEHDHELAEDVRQLFADIPRIEVREGDWSSLSDLAPFSMLFIDVKEVKEDVDLVADLLEPGGIVVLDEFEPSPVWPPIVDGVVDAVREQWLTDERFTAVEMLIDADASLVIAVRK